jgi:hypothetical protein
MGKQSRRNRDRTPRAPRTLPKATHPHFDGGFLPIALSADLLALDVVQTFQSLVADGALIKWELGRKGTHISSRLESAGGTGDILTSPDPNDQDYESLCKAHIQQAISICQSEDIEENGRQEPPQQVNEILNIWSAQKSFIRFMDGNTGNCAVSNLKYVKPVDAMNHMEWKVDWDINLSEEQIGFVQANAANFAHVLA